MVLLQPNERFGRLIAKSEALKEVFVQLQEAAPTEASVIIEGETGTGKELVAEAVHEHSLRASGPYIVVDCAAVARELIESELFGHAKGAFTGAVADRRGAFEAAHRGTIFIDELGELPLDLQPRLLRVLEKQEVRRVGSNQTKQIDVRVIAATNRDLQKEVAAGRFREDLYFRLAVLKIKLPPLRERPEDIRFLAQYFLANFPSFDGPLEIRELDFKALEKYDWPGNVRELRNVIDQGAALSDKYFQLPEDFGKHRVELDGLYADPGSGTGLLTDDHFSDLSRKHPSEARGIVPAAAVKGPGELTRSLWQNKSYKEAKEAVMADFETGYVRELLKTHSGNVSAAAKAAGIHRNILHRLIAKYGLTR